MLTSFGCPDTNMHPKIKLIGVIYFLKEYFEQMENALH